MLSGPDLGAGYLHQLSVDRDGERTTFTYHAQEGGADAAGPPKGPLGVFGYVHPAQACQFGGPRCWHRRFLLPFSETVRVRIAYNRSRFVLQAMLGQVYDSAPAALEPALREIIPRLKGGDVPWYLGGEAAAWLLGGPPPPRELRLGTTRPGVDRVAGLLREYLIEPVGPTDWPEVGIVHGARAFVGTFQSGARVEWGVSLDAPGVGGRGAREIPFEDVRTVPTQFEGAPVAVSRPEYALVRAWERGPTETVRPLLTLTRRLGPDRELLADLLTEGPLSSTAQSECLRTVDV
jgi:hypothetical protein